MNPLVDFEKFLDRMLEDCNDITLERTVRTIHWQFKQYTDTDIRQYISPIKCANDEIMSLDSKNGQ